MTYVYSFQSVLTNAVTRLFAEHSDAKTAKLEAQLLLQHVLNVNRAWLIAHQDDALEANIHAVFEALLNRRLNGEPIAYILGYREFYGLKLKVSPDTLIPRPDTETLVDAALAKIDVLLSPFPPFIPSPLAPLPQAGEGNQAANLSPSPACGRGVGERGYIASPSFPRKRESMLNLNQKMDSRFRRNDELSGISENLQTLRILDLGTGTGAIALVIAKHRPQTLVTAVDASQTALNIAIENGQNHDITNVHFVLSDWFAALHGNKFDVIVSNPPYIETYDTHLKQGDLRFEPIFALASGIDGLDAIRAIIAQAPQHLNPHGWLMLEHGYNQAEAVAALLKQAGFSQISHAKDLAGINRVTLGCT